MRSVTGEDAGKTTSLNDKLKQQLQDGNVTVGSQDVMQVTAPESDAADPAEEATTVTAPDLAEKDPVIESARNADAAPVQLQGEIADAERSRGALRDMIGNDVEVTVTPEEKDAFVEALISGERFELPFSLYDGRVTGVFRARSQAETVAIIRHLNTLRRTGEIEDMLEYATVLRNIILAAQVKVLNGEEYEKMAEPLNRTVKGEEVTEPGWLGQAKMWADKQEGLNAALYAELRKFEQKYWVMVDGADDQNFLNPEESTSE